MQQTGPIILLDVDETLLGADYEPNVSFDELTTAFRRAEARGATIGLNSDSGFSTLERAALHFGISGPIIAERGALIQERRDDSLEVVVVDAAGFDTIRSAFIDALGAGERLRQILVISGEVNDLADHLPPIPERVLPAQTIVLVNSVRSCSIAFYVRTRDASGSWVKDEAKLREVFSVLEEAGASRPELWAARDVDCNPTYGICIVHHRDSKKTRAVKRILEYARARPVYMVGNSTSDLLENSRIVQAAVGNASAAYKERCALIAEQPLTRGVMELLERIMR